MVDRLVRKRPTVSESEKVPAIQATQSATQSATFISPKVVDGKPVFVSRDGQGFKTLTGRLRKVTCKDWGENESLLFHFETEEGTLILSLPKTPYKGSKGDWKTSVLKFVSQLAHCDLLEPITLRLFKGKVADKEYPILSIDECDEDAILPLDTIKTSLTQQGVKFFPDPYRQHTVEEPVF